MRSFYVLILVFLIRSLAIAQSTSSTDTVKTLKEVEVQAYQSNRPPMETPVTVAIVGTKDFNRFNTTSLVSSMNTIPGVRMEERSPGSYRFSIRGSTIRSPFGVRNIKFYWNGLPVSDGGGSTYLNLLDVDAIGRAEVIKGPGASLYGAGTGGAVLLGNPFAKKTEAQVSMSGGTFGLRRIQGSGSIVNNHRRLFFNYAHQQSDGYRVQSALRRDAFNAEGEFSLSEKHSLRASAFYTDLYYQTPGGITQIQFDADPKQARTNAAAQQAAIYNKSVYASTSLTSQWSPAWSSFVGVYGSYSDFTNPSIFSYARNTDRNVGGRATAQREWQLSNWSARWIIGGEYQYFYTPLTNYQNNGGVKGAVLTDDQLTAESSILFTQADFTLPHNFFVTTGLSRNKLFYKINRLTGTPAGVQTRDFDAVMCARLALLKKFSERWSVFGSVSKGFSPPALAEILPSINVFNTTLQPEQGVSYEVGVKSRPVNGLSIDVSVYDFELVSPIVGLKNGANQDFFINANSNSQKGLEATASWEMTTPHDVLTALRLWATYTATHYQYTDYFYNIYSYSGNWLTGMPRQTISGGVDVGIKKFYLNSTATYVDRIPLNDANLNYASAYLLVGARAGYRLEMDHQSFELFGGVDNLLDIRYSLGNDLNASGGRFYNPAATRNVYLGIKVKPWIN